MARLLDEILRLKMAEENRQALLRCTVIDAQNVYEYINVTAKGEVIDTSNLPNCAPPLKDMFIEYRADPRHAFGWYLHSEEALPQFEGEILIPDPDLDARWTIYGWCFLEGLAVPVMQTRIVIGTKGEVRPMLEMYQGQMQILPYSLSAPDYSPFHDKYEREPFGEWKGVFILSLNTCLYTICFMHTKNVIQEDVIPPAKLSKAAEKKYKRPLLAYKVLKIRPMGGRRGEGHVSGEGSPLSLHIRRGHFKTFTEDKKLFGKHVGTYWWDQALVGDKMSGQVVKDYEPEPRKD